jgi:hypothetical protein
MQPAGSDPAPVASGTKEPTGTWTLGAAQARCAETLGVRYWEMNREEKCFGGPLHVSYEPLWMQRFFVNAPMTTTLSHTMQHIRWDPPHVRR